jgi:glycerophosphoryl diester phosphodiesterase
MNFWNDLSWVEPLRNPYITPFFENITLLGYPLFLVLFISFGYFFWSPARFTRVAMLLFISGIINSFLKDYFQDPRPAIEFMLDPQVGTSYGLPSGHAQIAVTLWGLLAYELKDKWVTTCSIILIVLICFSRLYLGVHDMGDIISGLAIGIAVLALWHIAIDHKIYEKFNSITWLFIILLFQLATYISYPFHEGHEPSVWSFGVMTGWYLGSSNIHLNLKIVKKLFVSLLSIAIVFFSMVITTRYEASIGLIGITGLLASYSLGLLFAFTVTWLLPRSWRFFNLTS